MCNSIKQWNVGTVITRQKLPDVHFFLFVKRLNHNISFGSCLQMWLNDLKLEGAFELAHNPKHNPNPAH